MKRQWREMDVRYYAIAASLLLSLYTALIKATPNHDAFTYLRAAEIYLQDGLAAAGAYYPWATYPVLIAELHAFSGMEMLNAAQVWNALFYALLSWAFITVAQEFDKSRRLSIIAAACILLYPQLNEYRPYIIRDIGYLAFSLTALLQLIRLNRYHRFVHAIGFTLACATAALFRPEAFAYLLLAPFALLFNTQKQLSGRLRAMMTVYGISLLLLAVAMLGLISANINPLQKIAQGVLVYQPFLSQAMILFEGGSPELSAAIFHEHAAKFSGQYIIIFLLTGLFSILFIKLFTGFGWVYLLTVLYGVKQRLIQVPSHIAAPMIAYLLIASSILLAFMFVTRFVTTRYTLLFATVMVLLVPIIVSRAAELAKQKNYLRTFNRVAGLLVIYLFIDATITFGESKRTERNAAEWIQQERDETQPLITNSVLIAYRAGLPDYERTADAIDQQLISDAPPGTRLIFTLRSSDRELMQQYVAENVLEVERIFPAEGPARVGIYRRLP
jgi:hypothetical protein